MLNNYLHQPQWISTIVRQPKESNKKKKKKQGEDAQTMTQKDRQQQQQQSNGCWVISETLASVFQAEAGSRD